MSGWAWAFVNRLWGQFPKMLPLHCLSDIFQFTRLLFWSPSQKLSSPTAVPHRGPGGRGSGGTRGALDLVPPLRGGSVGKSPSANAGDSGSVPGSERSHCSILGWKVPWTEEPGGLQSVGLKESDTTEQLSQEHVDPPPHEQKASPPFRSWSSPQAWRRARLLICPSVHAQSS